MPSEHSADAMAQAVYEHARSLGHSYNDADHIADELGPLLWWMVQQWLRTEIHKPEGKHVVHG